MDLKFDVVIVGLGVMGSSSFYHLSQKGLKILGIEQHESPHEFGSSGGQTRTVRTILYDDKLHADMMKESTQLWRDFQNKTDIKVFHEIPGIVFGQPSDQTVQNIVEFDGVQKLDQQKLQQLYGDKFTFPNGTKGAIDSTGGVGFISNAIKAFLTLGQKINKDSKILSRCRFIKYENKGPENILVYTDQGNFYTKKLIISAGYWINTMREDLRLKNHELYTGKVVTYFFRVPPEVSIEKGFPWFFSEEREKFLFAIPYDGYIKVGFHILGTIITNTHYHDKGSGDNHEAQIRDFFKRYLPQLKDAVIEKKTTCYYTMTSDEKFIVDFHPKCKDVLIMSPCSGHGFKFSILFGQMAVKMLETGKAQVEDFTLKRFQRPKL